MEFLLVLKSMFDGADKLLFKIGIITSIVFLGYKIVEKFKKNIIRLKFINSFNRELHITCILKEYKDKLVCDRVGIFQFHNGGHNINGVSFLKMSCTHEIVRYGISKEIDKLKNMYINEYMDWCMPLLKVNEVIYKDVDKEAIDPQVKEILQNMGIKSVIAVPLTTEGQVIGFVVASYCRGTHFAHEDFSKTFRTMYQLVGLLQDKLK